MSTDAVERETEAQILWYALTYYLTSDSCCSLFTCSTIVSSIESQFLDERLNTYCNKTLFPVGLHMFSCTINKASAL